MAKGRVTFEDHGERTVGFITEMEGMDLDSHTIPPSILFMATTRALFEAGVMADYAVVVLDALSNNEMPSAAVIALHKRNKSGE